MANNNVIGSVGYDDLFADGYPPADTFSVRIAGGQGVLVRGTLLAAADGGMVKISNETTGKATAVLAEDVDASEAARGIAYRTGHFNGNCLIVGDDYKITAADKHALRMAGILISGAYGAEITSHASGAATTSVLGRATLGSMILGS